MKSYIIRRAGKADAKAIFSLSVKLNNYITKPWKGNPLVVALKWNYKSINEEIKSYARDLAKKSVACFILSYKGRVAGYIFGNLLFYKNAKDYSKIGHIEELFIERRHRGMGWAKKLLNALIEWFESKGASYANLDVDKLNKYAKNFYKKNGFRVFMYSEVKLLKPQA